MKKIGTIINFCTIDYKFLGSCIDGVTPFSSIVIVPYADHLFDNTPENQTLIARAKSENPNAVFEEFEYHHSITRKLRTRFWHNFARWVGVSQLPEDIDYVLFLDADEIVEPEKFVAFLNNCDISQHDYMYFTNYWYFRAPCFRAKQTEDSPVMVRRSIINVNVIFHEWERSLFTHLGNGIRRVNGLDGMPMFHHYSWVLSKAEMLRKVRTWGHYQDIGKDWVSLIDEEFSREFNGTDFIHGYRYEKVTPYVEFKPTESDNNTMDFLIEAAKAATPTLTSRAGRSIP